MIPGILKHQIRELMRKGTYGSIDDNPFSHNF